MARQFLLLDNTNFVNYPTGGTLSFDKQLLKSVPPNQVSLAGITTDKNITVGKWTNVEIDGRIFNFFPIMRVNEINKKPFIPLRISSFFALLTYLGKIRKQGNLDVFTQTPQFLFALYFFKWSTICFCFAGVGNSVSLSRYKLLRSLGTLYEYLLFLVLKRKSTHILAAADSDAIDDLVKRSRGLLSSKKIKPFPTRFDESIFNTRDKNECRSKLNLPGSKNVFVSVGRLCWVKGWELLIDTVLLRNDENSILVFVGDGEDRSKIEIRAKKLIERGSIIITGYVSPEVVALYLNSADLVIVSSYQEGWPTSMVEALACGKTILSTNVSGAKDLITPGVNGYIIKERNPVLFNEGINECLKLKDSLNYSSEMSKKYSIRSLYNNLIDEWPEIKH